MSRNTSQRNDILQDLEDIYTLAMEKGNFAVALKAKELLGREQGLFSPKSPALNKEVCLADLSDEDITRLIEEIETQLDLDPTE